MANGAEDILEEIFPSMVESGEETVQSENVFSWEVFLETGQMLTGIDSGGVVASWLQLLDVDIPLLSGELDSGTIDSGTIERWNDGTIDSGTTEESISDPVSRLLISEVYFDGTDEWIEITNIGDGDFQGNVTLVGVKSTSLALSNISLLAGESKLFGDNIIQISGSQFIAKTGLAFNILDTAPINIQLFISGYMEDNFLVDQYRVNQYNDKKTSFEKVGWVSTRVQSDRTINAQSGYTINPGTYFGSGTVTNVSFPLTQNSGDLQLPIPCVSVDQRELMKINEIFPGNENYPAFIELAIYEDIFIDSLSISGDRLATGVEFSFSSSGMTLQKNSFLLLSATGFRQSEQLQSVRNDDFSLVSTWNWLVITIGSWQSRQVMDIVYSSGDTVDRSSYFASTSQQCLRNFATLDDFSPGFDKKFLKYLSGGTYVKIEYIRTGTQTESGVQTCPTTPQTDLFSWETQVATDVSGIFQQYTIRVMDVDYDPEGSDTDNETVTLLATNNFGNSAPIDLGKIFRLKVNGTNKTLPRILPMNIPTTFKKTFWFPNSTKLWDDVIIQLTYGDFIFDTYTYNPNKPILEEEAATGDVELTGLRLDLSGIQFTITYVLPNPKWSDTAEELGLLINYRDEEQGTRDEEEKFRDEDTGTRTSHQVPSPTSLILSQGFSLQIGKITKKIKGIVHGGQENILSWSLGLVNKAACVSLFYYEQELTKFCYGKPKEGEKIYANSQSLQEATTEDLNILNALQIKRVGNQMCIRYDADNTAICKRIPASKAEIKTVNEKNLYKGFVSLIKSYLLSDWNTLYYDTSLKGYYDLLAANKKLITAGISQVDIYGQSVATTNIKQQLEIYQTTMPAVIAIFEGINALSKH